MSTLPYPGGRVEEGAWCGREPTEKEKMGKLVPQRKYEESLNQLEIQALKASEFPAES